MSNTNITPRTAVRIRTTPVGEFVYVVDSNGSQVLDSNGQTVTLNDQGEAVEVTDSNGTDLGITL